MGTLAYSGTQSGFPNRRQMHHELILSIEPKHPIVVVLMVAWIVREGLEGLRAEECSRESLQGLQETNTLLSARCQEKRGSDCSTFCRVLSHLDVAAPRA